MLEAITAAVACVLLGVFGAAFVVGCAKKKSVSPQTKSKGLPQARRTKKSTNKNKSGWHVVKSSRKVDIESSEHKKPKSKLKKASVHSSAHDSTDDVGATSQTKSAHPTSSQYTLAHSTFNNKATSGYDQASVVSNHPAPPPPPPAPAPPPPDDDAFAMNKGEIIQDPGSGDGTANNGSGKTLKRPRRPKGPSGTLGKTTTTATSGNKHRKTIVTGTTTTAAQNGATNKSVIGLEEMVKRDAEKMKDEDTLVQ